MARYGECVVEPSAQERAFAAEVERCRAATQVSQGWVARQVGLSRPKISEICGGRYLPTREVLDRLVTALAMDRERAVELWRAAVQGRQRRRVDERADHVSPPTGWTALPPLPAEVRAVLRAQIQSARELPYRLPGARKPSLETIYVRQGLGNPAEELTPEQSRPEPVVDARGMVRLPAAPVLRLAVRPPARTLADVLDADDHLLVTGGPGQGKSTMSLRLTAEIAEAWERGSEAAGAPLAEPVVPLRITARELAARLELPFADALAGSARAEHGGYLSTDVDPGILARRVAGCRWLLLIDGVDEVASSGLRDRLLAVLAAWASDPRTSPYRLVVTTRPLEGGALAPLQRSGVGRYELQTFDAEALGRFAANWFGADGGDAARRFVQYIRAAYLDELVQVPLLATIAAIVFEQQQYAPLPDNQYELYEAYLAFLRSSRATAHSPSDAVSGPLLEQLGLVRLESDTSLVAAACAWIIDHSPSIARQPGWQDELTTFLAAVGPLVIRSGELRFLHHSFAEHLAATAKARLLPETFDAEHADFADLLHTAGQGDRGRQARAVLLHYARLQPAQADAILEFLHSGASDHHLLAAELLSQHLPAGAATVEAFLGTARAWAMTTQYAATRILQGVSRATHHPGLIPWLTSIMRDDQAPWQSRIEAAGALATRLRGPSSNQAVAMLRAAVDDASVPLTDRLTAAEHLGDCDQAERESTERGLRDLLVDPALPVRRGRIAAVILAGLSPAGRAHAVATLTRLLDDPETPAEDLVHAATGLAEIGTEFHDHCATALRTVLTSRVRTMDGRHEAAVGLAALGAEHLAAAVDALTALAEDRGFDRLDRLAAAKTLPEMGSQYRHAAAQRVREILAEPGLESYERWQGASTLAGLGAEFHSEAALQFRRVMADPSPYRNAPYWAVQELHELGPEFWAEALEGFHQLLADPRVTGMERAASHGQLARMGPPHRAPAIRELLAHANDRNTRPELRSWAASQLADLGPDNHAEAAAALTEVVAMRPEPDRILWAAQSLVHLGSRHRDHAVVAVRKGLESIIDLEDYYAVHNAIVAMTDLLEPGEWQHLTHIFLGLLGDSDLMDWLRATAAASLMLLGRDNHRAATAGFIALLHPAVDPELLDSPALSRFLLVGPALRREVADALRALLPAAGATLTWQVARALVRLGADEAPDVRSALRDALADPTATPDAVRGAATTLARLDDQALPEAVTALRTLLGSDLSAYHREAVLFDLGLLGDDVVSLTRAVLADQNTEHAVRGVSASVLAQMRPGHADEAITELRSQAEDEYLSFWQRDDAATRVAQLEDAGRMTAVELSAAMLDDEEAPIGERCRAAETLISLDPTRWHPAVATLRRLSAYPFTAPVDQQAILATLVTVKAVSTDEATRIAHGILHDPAAQPAERRWATMHMTRPARADANSMLLADHSMPISLRVPQWRYPDGRPMVIETAIAMREALTAEETTAAERVDAAVALAALSPRFIPAGARELERLADGRGNTADRATAELATLGSHQWRMATELAGWKISNSALPRRERLLAAVLLDRLGAATAASQELLRQVATDPSAPAPQRVAALLQRGRRDGLGPARVLRDAPGTPAATRWQITIRLLNLSPTDRAAAAEALDTIATDPTAPAALRWRAAADLARLGTRGRQRAADRLRTLSTDRTLPLTVRASAARALADTGPSRRPEAVAILKDLAKTANPPHRRAVLLALGHLDPAHALPQLRAMAQDHTLPPPVRLHCATALASLRRDERDAAAAIARVLMNDDQVPHHTRRRAARRLAQWSPLCRQEARSYLRRTGTGREDLT
jgi:hypothetical protein